MVFSIQIWKNLFLAIKDKVGNLASSTPDLGEGRRGVHFKCEGGDPDLNKCAATVITTTTAAEFK